MMGRRTVDQSQLFYLISTLSQPHPGAFHLLRRIGIRLCESDIWLKFREKLQRPSIARSGGHRSTPS